MNDDGDGDGADDDDKVFHKKYSRCQTLEDTFFNEDEFL